MYNLFPSIFPFLLITKLIFYYNVLELFGKSFGKYISNIFNVSINSTFVIISSIFNGFPTGAILTKELLENNKINISEANKLITFTSFANPIFIISFVGETLLKNKYLGVFIYISHIVSGLLISFLFKNKYTTNNNHNYNNPRKEFSSILMKSINESFITLINILGIIIFFLLVISIIDTFLPNTLFSLLIKPLIELTTGVIYVSKLNINLRLKVSILGAIISFNGLSVHFQIKSIIDNTKIKYNYYLYARILHSILCFIILFLFFNIIYF